MNNQKKKCSQIEHQENDAINYCKECNLYLCNKCDNSHSMLFKKHQKFTLDKDINEIFTGFCKEINHGKELKYFCKNHNKLCCAVCICKIKDKENGQHKDCNVCILNDIKEEKKLILKDNIKYLDSLSDSLENSIKELKQLNEKINEKKEELKTKIQKVFTKIRNELNDREDKLFEEIDKKFSDLFLNDDITNKSEKLPDKIKNSLQQTKFNEEDWNDENKLNLLINNSINIENIRKDINIIYDNIKKTNINEFDINFIPEETELNNFLEKIKEFGCINFADEIYFDDKSTIIENKNNLDFVIKQIKINNNIKIKKNCKLNILYRIARDGDSCKTYHQKTNNIPDTLTLIKTKENIIFGGYTHIKIPFVPNGSNFDDSKAFLFSLDYNKIYFPQKNHCSKHSNENYGPIFGNNENCQYPIIVGGPNFLSNNYHSTSTVKGCFYDNFSFDYELNKGKKNFQIKEIEVYQIIFE